MSNVVDARGAASRLRAVRLQKGLTAESTAIKLCMLTRRYKALEQSFPLEAQRRYLAPLAAALGVSESWLATGGGLPPDGVALLRPDARVPVYSVAQRRSLRGQREILAEGAKARRIELGISFSAMAAMIDVTSYAFRRWESCLLLNACPEEALWEQRLEVPEGWLRDEVIRAQVAQSN